MTPININLIHLFFEQMAFESKNHSKDILFYHKKSSPENLVAIVTSRD
jgi:hypothetical protein